MSVSLSKDEFVTFVLIYAAHGDRVVKDSETEYIKERTSAELYDKVFEAFDANDHVRNFQILLRHKEMYYPGRQGSEDLLGEMESVFLADGEYHDLEHELFTAVRNVFSGITQ